MNDCLGHDINGRPLRAGDVCATTGKPGHPFNGVVCTVLMSIDRADGDIAIETSQGSRFAFHSSDLRKLDNHQPAGSFDEVMAG